LCKRQPTIILYKVQANPVGRLDSGTSLDADGTTSSAADRSASPSLLTPDPECSVKAAGQQHTVVGVRVIGKAGEARPGTLSHSLEGLLRLVQLVNVIAADATVKPASQPLEFSATRLQFHWQAVPHHAFKGS
jgi:hypothetical protein